MADKPKDDVTDDKPTGKPDDDNTTDTTDDRKDNAAEVEKWKALARKHEKNAKANADAAKRLQEIEDEKKSETERTAERVAKAEKDAADAVRESARLRVALKKGLTETQAKRLVGDTEEDLEADA